MNYLLNLGATNMKKILPVAVLAALAGVNGAQAVHVNPDGLGQVLIYPFYSIEGLNDTYINLVNTTDDYKAVKIRFLESMNSKEVLDFNIYLSPRDHWSAVVTTTLGDGITATMRSDDNSCTVPLAVSQGATIPFRTFAFGSDDSVKGVERTREGYVEVIEMGTVTDSTYQAAMEHDSDGVPPNCALLNAAWEDGGFWESSNGDAGMSVLTGGLYGYGVLINVPKGASAGYEAVAIDDWIDTEFFDNAHTEPGSLLPSLGSVASPYYDVFDEGGVVSGEAFDGWDAVSAVLMHASIANDYVLEPTVAGGTDWVVTFPTKQRYVNGPDAPEAPFTSEWDPETSTACEEFAIGYWDREEQFPITIDPNDFSPPPPTIIPTFSFCHEANVLTFDDSDVLDASDRTGVNLDLEDGFINGWAEVSFGLTGTGDPRTLETFDDTFVGLPSIGFMVQRYLNGDPAGTGVLANYAVAVNHKHRITVSTD
jgi:hypothetical protein